MKNKILAAMLFSLCSFPFIQFLNQSKASTSDRTEILALIERESEAFWDKDFEAYADCWAHADYIRTMGWWAAGGVTVVEGWEERGHRTRNHMIAHPDPNPQNPVRKNMNIRIGSEMAWVTFDQYGRDTDDPTFDMPGLSRETRILEKIDGKWKIVYVGWLLQGEPKSPLTGTWALLSGQYGDRHQQSNSTPHQYKMFDGNNFIFSRKNSGTKTGRSAVGRYTVNGNTYRETFVQDTEPKFVGITAEWQFETYNDTLIMEGPTRIFRVEKGKEEAAFPELLHSMHEIRVRVK